jgi:hypothetical protein
LGAFRKIWYFEVPFWHFFLTVRFIGSKKVATLIVPVKSGLGRAWPDLVGGLGAWTVGLAQKPGPLELLVYVVKARAGPT